MTEAHLAHRPAAARILVVATLAVVGALLVEPAIGSDPAVRGETGRPGAWIAVALATAAISVLHASIAARAKTATGVFWRCLGLGIVLGVVNSGLSLSAVQAVTGGPGPGLIAAFFLGSVFGSFLGGFWGLAFGLAYMPLVALAVAQRQRPTAEDLDVALVACGAMLLAAAALRHVLVADASWVPLAAAIAAVIAIARGSVAFVARRRFLGRVRGGAVDGWLVVSSPDASCAAGLPALLRGGTDGAILCRAHKLGTGAYRGGEGWAPVARLGGLTGGGAPVTPPRGAPRR